MPQKKIALVLASFGTTREQEEDFVGKIKDELLIRHPEMDIFVAVTSKLVANNRRRKGQAANALAQVLSDLSSSGYTHVAVQSLHVVPGMEFDMLSDITRRFAHMPKGIISTAIGQPLINNDKTAEQVAKVLIKDFAEPRQPDEAVVFIGHGAKHPSGTLAYPALQAYLWQHDHGLYVGTVEGRLSADVILNLMKEKGIKKAWLVPLLAYYGTHVVEDLFGESNSWLQHFEENGITCHPVKKTLLARPAITAIWVDHAIKVLESLNL